MQYPSNATSVTFTIDGRSYATTFLGILPNVGVGADGRTFTFKGTDDIFRYETWFDELNIWNRLISASERTSIYNSRTGYFYPYPPLPTIASRIVSGVTIEDSGVHYAVAPTVTFDSPTGGGGATASGHAEMVPDTGRIYADSLPAFSVGNTNSIVTAMMSGSGRFYINNNDFLRVGNVLHTNDWSLFMNIRHIGTNPSGVSEVLVSTMDNVNQTSGFIFGINNASRLFFEYLDTTNPNQAQRRVFIQNLEMSENNLISLSTDSINNSITVCNHTLAKQATYGASFYVPGYRPSNVLFLGGFTNSGNNNRYTGFNGIFKDILLLSGAANAVQMSAIAPLFCISGYNPESEVPIYTYFSIVTGAQFIGTVVETGVTGYVLQDIEIPDKDGTPIPACDMLAVLGEISGTGVVYQSGNYSGTSVSYSGIEEELFYDNAYLRNYADSCFVMLNYAITNKDVLELYSYTEKWPNKISVMPEAFNIYDFYLSSDFSSGNANVYQNGLLQIQGIDYILNSGKIVSTNYSQYHSSYSYLLYDEISGTTVAMPWTGYSGSYNMGGDWTWGMTRDIYLNGQKLTSGIDYYIQGVDSILTGTINGETVVWASGYLMQAPIRTGNLNRFTGTNLLYYHNFSTSLGRLMDEMAFLNGQRLAPGQDYLTVSPDSLIAYDYRPGGWTAFSIYSGDLFETGISAKEPNITAPINNPSIPVSPPEPS